MQSAPWPTWFVVTMGLNGLALIYLHYRWANAKTRSDYITCIALYIGISIVATVSFPFSGIMPAEVIERHTQQAPTPTMPPSAVLAFAIWLIGGNFIAIRQLRKAGRPWWHIFNPFNGLMQHMDGKAWLAILLLALVSLAIAKQGLHDSAVNRSPPPTQKSP